MWISGERKFQASARAKPRPLGTITAVGQASGRQGAMAMVGDEVKELIGGGGQGRAL